MYLYTILNKITSNTVNHCKDTQQTVCHLQSSLATTSKAINCACIDFQLVVWVWDLAEIKFDCFHCAGLQRHMYLVVFKLVNQKLPTAKLNICQN